MRYGLWVVVVVAVVLIGVSIEVGGVETQECDCNAKVDDGTLYAFFMLTTNKTSIPIRTFLPFRRELVLPSIDLALNYVNESGLLGDYILKPIFVDVKCDPLIAQVSALNLREKYHGQVIFGPCCPYPAASVARLNSVWQMPLVTPAALAPDFRKEESLREFNTTTRTGPTYIDMGRALVEFFKLYNWKIFTQIISDETNENSIRDHFFLCSGIYEAFDREGNFTKEFYVLREDEIDIDEALKITATKARDTVFLSRCKHNYYGYILHMRGDSTS
ncbi:atrial natriuretic peptide receptor 3-like [Anneissia japonica]|uniref:atrial natriuretic peptide receptor 3-like n=1 Tax=Anneissia japonica TaxID=1529436 RepID=UPI00142552C3|nr:atrial natriuretic peptide receptor 3-like [Anneissia japonica]